MRLQQSQVIRRYTRTDRGVACLHERSQVADSRFHGHAYASATTREIFCDVCRLERWLDVEVELARSQAELGIIPVAAAETIARAARIDRLDQGAIAAEIKATRHSLVGLLRALEGAVGRDAAKYIHFGATTQDIQDTGQALEMRDVFDAVERGLSELVQLLEPIARAHQATLMVGRTHARAALPVTFGLKVAGWIDELLRHLDRIAQARPRVLVAQLAGGVGTMAAWDERGPHLLERFAERLGLAAPRIGWHASRDRVAEFACILGMVVATMARIAEEVRMLGRPEIDELEEDWAPGQIGSSTMPHKRNPEVCEQVVVLARLARCLVPSLLDAMVVEHERDARALRLEWPSLADISHYTVAAQEMVLEIISGLRVHSGTMERHARAVGDMICSESLMLALVDAMGKGPAYERVYLLTQEAISRRIPLARLLAEDPEITAALGNRLAQVLDPAAYLGSAGALVGATLAEVRRRFDVPARRYGT